MEVICESPLHAGRKDAERHFCVQIASNRFEGLRTVEMHRMVNKCLAEELAGPVHALRIDAYPSSKFEDQQPTESPKCEKGKHGTHTN
ncbi:unnamed protein product [Anisakis simplex]|uniref:Uncharacterized protein n=1 Tax=Anisakis simplex TaxID=6269 RepID=A0A3P6QSU9_ANISI|nr:unnamed protein product [Anisakis simplex]